MSDAEWRKVQRRESLGEQRERGCTASWLYLYCLQNKNVCFSWTSIGVFEGSCPRVVVKETQPRTPTERWAPGSPAAEREGIAPWKGTQLGTPSERSLRSPRMHPMWEREPEISPLLRWDGPKPDNNRFPQVRPFLFLLRLSPRCIKLYMYGCMGAGEEEETAERKRREAGLQVRGDRPALQWLKEWGFRIAGLNLLNYQSDRSSEWKTMKKHVSCWRLHPA